MKAGVDLHAVTVVARRRSRPDLGGVHDRQSVGTAKACRVVFTGTAMMAPVP